MEEKAREKIAKEEVAYQYDPSLDWTTQDEVNFLRNLGFFRGMDRVVPYDRFPYHRLELLEQYEASMISRKYWGQIDRHIVHQELTEMLEEERKWVSEEESVSKAIRNALRRETGPMEIRREENKHRSLVLSKRQVVRSILVDADESFLVTVKESPRKDKTLDVVVLVRQKEEQEEST